MKTKPIPRRTLLDIFVLGTKVVRSKLISRSIRMIRFPIDIRGRKYIDFGKSLSIGKYCRLEVYRSSKINNPLLKFGERVQLNDFVHITTMQSVEIGNNVLMASHIYISDCQHGFYSGQNASNPNEHPMERDYLIAPVRIEDDVWIGEHVSILPGVTIGKGTVIGANSVVTKSIPAYSIAVGSPAKVVKQWDNDNKTWKRV